MRYWHKSLPLTTLAERGLRVDQDLAEQARSRGCGCSGTLHAANFPRKCFALLAGVLTILGLRFSFCCASCRKRTTPPSVRFLGRRHYWGVLVVLLSAARGGVADRHLILVAQELGISVSETTLSRWVSWWRGEFVVTELWRIERGRFLPPVAAQKLPLSLLERFGATASDDGLLAFLEFLSPLTTASCEPIRRSSAMVV